MHTKTKGNIKMQLTGPEILRRMRTPNMNNPGGKSDIIITPFNEKCLGSNREPDCLGAGSSAFHTIQRAANFGFS